MQAIGSKVRSSYPHFGTNYHQEEDNDDNKEGNHASRSEMRQMQCIWQLLIQVEDVGQQEDAYCRTKENDHNERKNRGQPC